MREFTHLWNNLSKEERSRLIPHMYECQILHIEQTKERAIRAHASFLRETNNIISNIKKDLSKYSQKNVNKIT